MPLKIIYLDDEAALCEVFIDLFGADDREINVFSSPDEFLKCVGKIAPDVIFLDYRLPGMSSEAIAEKLNPAIRCAIITGELDLDLGPKANIERVFYKPFSCEEIEAYLGEIIKSKNAA